MREREKNWWKLNSPVVKSYIKEVEAEVGAEIRATDPVAQQCKHASFVSRSKGRGKLRNNPKEVELICYRGKCIENRDGCGPLDKWATEVLGDSVDPDRAEEEFLRRVRALG